MANAHIASLNARNEIPGHFPRMGNVVRHRSEVSLFQLNGVSQTSTYMHTTHTHTPAYIHGDTW